MCQIIPKRYLKQNSEFLWHFPVVSATKLTTQAEKHSAIVYWLIDRIAGIAACLVLNGICITACHVQVPNCIKACGTRYSIWLTVVSLKRRQWWQWRPAHFEWSTEQRGIAIVILEKELSNYLINEDWKCSVFGVDAMLWSGRKC